MTDLPQEAIPQLESILKAGTIAFGPAGFAGTIPDATQAYWRLLQAPYGVALFRQCAESGNPTARLYGLMGLYQMDRPTYFDIAVHYRDDTSEVMYLRGCIGTAYTLNRLLAHLEAGQQEADLFLDLSPESE